MATFKWHGFLVFRQDAPAFREAQAGTAGTIFAIKAAYLGRNIPGRGLPTRINERAAFFSYEP